MTMQERIKKAIDRLITKRARLFCDGCGAHAKPHKYAGFSISEVAGSESEVILTHYKCSTCGTKRVWGCFDIDALLGQRRGVHRMRSGGKLAAKTNDDQCDLFGGFDRGER